MATLRTQEGEKKYQDYIARGGLENGCALCPKAPLRMFKFWKIVQNDFPYDRIASIHHMVIPIRHAGEAELSTEERDELANIKDAYMNAHYEYFIEAARKNKSIPGHFHLHLIVMEDQKNAVI